MKKFIYFFCIIFCLFQTFYTQKGKAQIYDATFLPKIVSVGYIRDIKKQIIDGQTKTIIVGRFSTYNGVSVNNIVRLNQDGSIDEGFRQKTGFGANSTINSIAIDDNNNIYLAGDFIIFNGFNVNRIIKLSTTGELDEDFLNNIGTGANLSINQIAIQKLPNGESRIVAGGAFTDFNDTGIQRITRINLNGTLDLAFLNNIGGGANFAINAIVVQPDAKILIGGLFTFFNQLNTQRRLLRLNPDGTRDNSFNTGNGPNNEVLTISLDTENGILKNILVGGEFTTFNNKPFKYAVRISPSGTLDETFNPQPNGFVNQIKANSIGIYIGGNFTSVNLIPANKIAKFNLDGTLNTDFSNNVGNAFPEGEISKILLEQNNEIMIGGTYDIYKNKTTSLVKLNQDGISTAFGDVILAKRMNITTIFEQSNKQILIGGEEKAYVNGKAAGLLFRLNEDGSLDTTFQNNLGTGPNGIVNSIVVQPHNNRVLVAGQFTSFNGQTLPYIVRLNSNGTFDNAFNNQVKEALDDKINVVKVQADRKILIGGAFTTYKNNPLAGLLRINENGTGDNSFNNQIAPGFNGEVNAIGIQSDNKIVAAGAFTNFKDETANRIVRLEVSGVKNSGFVTSGSNERITFVEIQKQDNILVGGNFSSFNGIAQYGLVKLNKFGAIDNTFLFKLDPENFRLFNIGFQPIGEEQKILLAGNLNLSTQSGSRRYLSRLNENGTPDESFNIDNTVNIDNSVGTYVLNNGDILLYGDFEGTLIKLKTPPPPPRPTNLSASSLFGTSVDLKWETSDNSVFFQVQRSLISGTNYDIITTTNIGETSFTDNNIDFGKQYFYRVRAVNTGNASIYSNEISIIISPLITNISTQDLEKKLQLFPNPSNEDLTIDISKLSHNQQMPLEIEILNITGNVVFAKKVDVLNHQKISISSFSKGIYYIKIKHRAQEIVKKIVKY